MIEEINESFSTMRIDGRYERRYSAEEVNMINEEIFEEEFERDAANALRHFAPIKPNRDIPIGFVDMPYPFDRQHEIIKHRISKELDTIIKQETWDTEAYKKYWDGLSEEDREKKLKASYKIDLWVRRPNRTSELANHAKRAQRYNAMRRELKGLSGFGRKASKRVSEETEYRNKQTVMRKIEKWIRDNDNNFVTGIGYYLIEVSDSMDAAKLSEIFKKAKEEVRQSDKHKGAVI